MQRSISKLVFSLQIWFQTQNIVECHLRSCETCPMKRSAVLSISDININPLLMQVVNTQWLILLSSNVHCSWAKAVLEMHVSLGTFTQYIQHSIVSMFRRKMKRSKLIICGFIYKISDLFVIWLILVFEIKSVSLNILIKDLKWIWLVPICTVCQNGEVSWIFHILEVQWEWLNFQILNETLPIFSCDQCEKLLSMNTFNKETWWCCIRTNICCVKCLWEMRDVHQW